MILQNVRKFTHQHWDKIGEVFNRLFDLTTASELFDYDPLHKGRIPSVTELTIDAAVKKKHQTENSINETEESLSKTVQRAHEEESSEDVGNEMKSNNTNIYDNRNSNRHKIAKDSKTSKNNDDPRNRINVKNSIVVKCVLQLLMIELLSELFAKEEFEHHIPFQQAIKVTELLQN